MVPPAQARRRRGHGRERVPAVAKVFFDEVDDCCAFLRTVVRHQPARALGYPQTHEIDDGREHGAYKEREAPSRVAGEKRFIKNDDRADCPDGGADPEAAVNCKIGPAAIPCRNEFLDRRVDGGILAADPGAGHEPKHREAGQIPGERGCGSERQIDRQRHEEESSSAQPVGQPTEKERAENGAEHIGGACKTDTPAGESQAAPDGAGERAGERNLQAVEDPCDAEREDNKPMEPAPWKPVQTGRNVRFDDRAVRLRARQSCRV